MRAGELKHSITVQRKVVTGTGDRGQPVYHWATRSQVRANIEELSGRKLELARQLIATATHRVTLRFLSGLAIKDRILYKGRHFNINSIQDEQLLGFSQSLLCTEEVGLTVGHTYEPTGGLLTLRGSYA